MTYKVSSDTLSIYLGLLTLSRQLTLFIYGFHRVIGILLIVRVVNLVCKAQA